MLIKYNFTKIFPLVSISRALLIITKVFIITSSLLTNCSKSCLATDQVNDRRGVLCALFYRAEIIVFLCHALSLTQIIDDS